MIGKYSFSAEIPVMICPLAGAKDSTPNAKDSTPNAKDFIPDADACWEGGCEYYIEDDRDEHGIAATFVCNHPAIESLAKQQFIEDLIKSELFIEVIEKLTEGAEGDDEAEGEEGEIAPFDEEKWRAAVEQLLNETGWHVHPKRGMDVFSELVRAKGGRCPCAPETRTCPCKEIYEDMKERNACKCTCIVNDEYLEQWGHGK